MKHLSKYVVSLVLALSATSLSAQTNDSIFTSLHSETLQASKDTQSATLAECLEKGLDKNYSLRIIRNKEQMAANNATMENAGSNRL